MSCNQLHCTGSCGERRSAAERVPRDAAAEQADADDQEEAGQEGSGHAEEDERGGLRQVLRRVRNQHQARSHGGSQQQVTATQSAELYIQFV